MAVTTAAPSVAPSVPLRATTMAPATTSAAVRAASTLAPQSGAGARAVQSEQNLAQPTFDPKKKAAAAKAATTKRPNPAKQAAASRAIAAGQRLARHKKGRSGSKLVSLGRKAQAKATTVKGFVDTVLGVIGMDAALAVQSEINWEASLNGLAQAADIASTTLALADKVQAADPKLAQAGYAIADQAQAIIDNYGGDNLFDFFDNSIPGAVASVAAQASAWAAQAQPLTQGSASAAAAAQAAAATADQAAAAADGGGFGGGGGGGGGGFGDDGGGDAQAAAEMAAEAGGGGGGDGVDWGEGDVNERDVIDEQRDTSTAMPDGGDGTYAEIPENAEKEPESAEKPLQSGDTVVSIDKPDAGEGIVKLVVADAADVEWKDGSVTSEPLDKLQRAESAQKADVMGDHYIHGVDVLAGDAGTGGAPSAPMDYGPSIGPQPVYTDRPTILAAQKALSAKGYMLGPADGIFGPQTEAALFKFSGKHGPPDADTLKALGVAPGGGSTGSVISPITNWLSRAFDAATSPSAPAAAPSRPVNAPVAPPRPAGVAPMPPGWWVQPAWQGAPFKRWQAATAAGGSLAILTGIVMAARR